MFYGILAAFAVFSVVLDQVVKYLVVQHIPLGGVVPLWPGVIHLPYVKNTGMSFSLLQGQRWFFVVVTLLIFVALFLAVRPQVDHPSPGAVGAGRHRRRRRRKLHRPLFLGYVVDMFEVEFMRFAVFNVADSFLVCGAILLVVYVLFFDRKAGKEPSHDSDR